MATTEIASTPKELDAGMMIRRSLFLLLLLTTLYFFLSIDFRGLTSPKGMDQAQIARQIAARGSFSTLCIRPICYAQVERVVKAEQGDTAAPKVQDGIPDTYHAPLNPLLNSLALGVAKDSWKFGPKQVIYTPDMIIAGVSMVLLLASIGVNYLLVSRIFDTKIGGVTALLMLLCESFWRFSQSGLPQMLMLFLFSFGMYFLYKAMENSQAGRSVYLWISLTAGFFGLLALAHWIAIWPFLGLLLFVGYYFTPRGIPLLILIGIFGLITVWWPILQNAKYTGNPLGAGLYLFYAGMGGTENEEALMRDYEQTAGGLNFDGFVSKIVANSISQISDLYSYLGSIAAAPLFFLALLHPFRRREIADFRWCILLMWLFSVVGMTLYGIKPWGDERNDSNNLHILFAPLMSGYGLAFLAVLWNRLSLPLQVPAVRNAHYILIVAITCIPMLLQAVQRTIRAMVAPSILNTNYPHYVPRAISQIAEAVKENEAVVTDIPWAVAWYADRPAFWLPKDKRQLETLRAIGKDHGQPITAAFFSYATFSQPQFHLTMPRSSSFEWREYAAYYATVQMFPPAVRESLISELPYKYRAGVGDDGNANYVYLLLTESPVARKENQ